MDSSKFWVIIDFADRHRFLIIWIDSSYSNFGNALVFKEIKDEHINTVENFIRNDIAKVCKLENSEDFYGRIYAKCPEKFAFLPGERVLIKQLVSHVNGIVDQNGKNTGLCHFKPPKDIQDESNLPLKAEVNTTSKTNSFFLDRLISNSRQNSDRKQGGYRYDSDTQKFATYLRMIMGPLAYQTLQANLVGSIPSLPSINRYIQSSHYHIIEGVLRAEELRIYLEERKLPYIVSLSEDATVIIGRVQYDPRTNQIVGFVLPLNSQTGMPIPFAFPARNANEIMKHFSTGSISTNLIVVMAQPLEKTVPPFCLLVFGSDCKYTALDVKRRWKHIESELAKVGITVLTISTDSEPRYNATMRELSGLGIPSKTSWFSSSENISTPIYVQDMTHIITKLRNLLLRTKWCNKKLPFGKFSVDMIHLYVLLYKYSKDHHQLTESVLNPADRQNFSSAERMCNQRVTTLLNADVNNSQATSLFLKMMRDIMCAYMDPNLTPLQRIRSIWVPVFVLRIWRNYIENHKQYTLKNNFLSLNCYVCIELNAHSLVQLIIHLRNTDQSHLFLPHLFESQPCESTFRQFRSLSSTYSTKVNCTVKEASSRISNINLQNDIMHGSSEHFNFPRLKKRSEFVKQNHYELPSKDEIFTEIENCQKDAINIGKEFGLMTNRNAKTLPCKIGPHKIKSFRVRSREHTESNIQRDVASLDLNNIKLKDFSGTLNETNIDSTSPYVVMQNDFGETSIVKKMSLCWLLRGDVYRVSSERSDRVRNPPQKSKTQLKTFKIKYDKLKRKQTKKRMK